MTDDLRRDERPLPTTVLVTGAAGFIGSHLVDRLLVEGVNVIGIDNFDSYYDPMIKRGNLSDACSNDKFRLFEGDIRDHALLNGIFASTEIDAVVHLAAKAGVRSSIEAPEEYVSVNIMGTTTLLEAMRCHGVSRMLFASSSSVYGNRNDVPFKETDSVDRPISPYAATKKAGELICHTYASLHQMHIWCLRFFTVYGPRQRPEMAIARFLDVARNDAEVTVYGDGSMQRDYTYVGDIVYGLVMALARVRGYEVANIGGSHSYSLNEVLEAVEAATGKLLQRRYAAVPPGDVQRTAASVEKAAKLFCFAPRVSLKEGINQQWTKLLQLTKSEGIE